MNVIPRLEQIPLEKLVPSKWNPRKHYDVIELQQLADSLVENGLFNPLSARPLGKQFEIAGGERRYRAAKLIASMTTVAAGEMALRLDRMPEWVEERRRALAVLDVFVREMGDEEFLELVNIDNLQRANLHPMEEAQGFATLIKEARYDIAKIAGKVNRSTDYVYNRLQLLKLVPAAQALFIDGRFTLGHAIVISRQARDVQEKIIKLDPWGRGGSGALWEDQGSRDLFDEEHEETAFELVKPVTVQELEGWINGHVGFDAKLDVVPQLFPETVVKLHVADEDGRKVVFITYNDFVQPSAKDSLGDQRVYGPMSWTRADGLENSKSCDCALLGLVFAGPHRGEAFNVCIAKKKCTTHYAADVRKAQKQATVRKAADAGDATAKAKIDRSELQQRANDAKRARQEQLGKIAYPIIAATVIERIRSAPSNDCGAAGKIGGFLVEMLSDDDIYIAHVVRQQKVTAKAGKTAEQLVKWIAEGITVTFGHTDDLSKLAQRLGVDVAKIQKAAEAKLPKEIACIHCKCTESNACPGGCSWVSKTPPVCSNPKCVAKQKGVAAPITKPKGGKKKGVRANAPFMQPQQPSAALAKIVGSNPLPRTETTKKVWAYIKKHGLQDKKNRRMIKTDAALGAIIGTGTVNMFMMTDRISKHLTPVKA